MIKIKRGAESLLKNEVIPDGQPVLTIDDDDDVSPHRFKVGDGTTECSNLPYISLNEKGVQPISKGGTGKDNRADAFSNIADYGSIDGSSDVPEVWASKGSGIHYFQSSSGGSGGGGAPSVEYLVSNSIVQSWVEYRPDNHLPTAITQFKITTTGQCYTRYGRVGSTTWLTPWTRLLVASEEVQIVKIWENASPLSAFVNQTLTLDFSSYDLIIILFNLDSNGRSTTPAIVPVGHSGISVYANNVRSFLSHTNDIQFDTVSPSSAVMIPYVIYGVKGVI